MYICPCCKKEFPTVFYTKEPKYRKRMTEENYGVARGSFKRHTNACIKKWLKENHCVHAFENKYLSKTAMLCKAITVGGFPTSCNPFDKECIRKAGD